MGIGIKVEAGFSHMVYFVHPAAGRRFIQMIPVHNTAYAFRRVCIEKDGAHTGIILQDGGGTAAHNHAGALPCQTANFSSLSVVNHLAFRVEQVGHIGSIGQRIAGEHGGEVGGALLTAREQGLAETGIVRCALKQQLIVAGNPQGLCHTLTDFTPAASILTANTENKRLQNKFPFSDSKATVSFQATTVYALPLKKKNIELILQLYQYIMTEVIDMNINYEYYRCFYYVAKYRNLTRAAEAMLSSQPNVTRAMNALEQALGCRLLSRSNRGVALTPEGERLYSHVCIAQQQLQEGEAELAAGKDLRGGVVTVGASETALHGLLLPVLRRFQLDYPGVRIRISNHSTPQAVAALRSGQVELAVVTTPTGVRHPLEEARLVDYREILIAGPRFASLAGETIALAQLADYPLICLGRETKTYEFYQQLFARHGLALQPDVEAATADQILPLVCSDLGLGFLPERFAAGALERGEVFAVALAEPIPERSICLVTDKNRPLGRAAQTLERRLRAAARRKS